MCLTIPAKILEISQGHALVRDYNNQEKKVIIGAISGAKTSDWILINGNLAIQKISATEAEEISNLLK